MKIAVMIVDDEPMAREEMRRLLAADDSFKICAEAGSGTEALKKLKEMSEIDVVFLDIDMPGLSGLEVASKLADWPSPPIVVFATAYNQYALEAFEANAADYFLKPYDASRIRQSFEKIKSRLREPERSRKHLRSLDEELQKRGLVKKLVGYRRNSKERIVIQPEDVAYFEARYSEVWARISADSLRLNTTLKELSQILDETRFAQTHKSYVVNIDKIEKVSPLFSGNFQITLKEPSGEKIPLSRRYAKALKNLLGNW